MSMLQRDDIILIFFGFIFEHVWSVGVRARQWAQGRFICHDNVPLGTFSGKEARRRRKKIQFVIK